jgi:protein-tyrosine phosphatase
LDSDHQRILFVCLGNIVRSPLAQALFEYYLTRQGHEHRFTADSAGTSTWHAGEYPDRRMLQVAAGNGIKYSHRARQVTTQDLDKFDMLVAMDRDNFEDLKSMAKTPKQQGKIYMLRRWDPQGGDGLSVPDPFYGGTEGFEEVYQVIDRSVQELLKELIA